MELHLTPLPENEKQMLLQIKHGSVATAMCEKFKDVNPLFLYTTLNGELPHKDCFDDIDNRALIDELHTKVSHLNDCHIKSTWSMQHHGKKPPMISSGIWPLTKDLWIVLEETNDRPLLTSVYHSSASGKETVEAMKTLIKKFRHRHEPVGRIFLLQSMHGHYELMPFKLNVQALDLNDNYNDDFRQVSELIIKRLNTKNDKGLVLLHGQPGTGKTSYIRHLVRRVKKRMIFLPPDIAARVASPDFVQTLGRFTDSVLIIEDAENLIMERSAGERSAVSTLLNLTDGLLADCFHIQVVCTFNTDISRLDKALLRKGRLIAKYEFGKLKKDKAHALSLKLGHKHPVDEEMSLTEIYNREEKDFSGLRNTPIGFIVDNSSSLRI